MAQCRRDQRGDQRGDRRVLKDVPVDRNENGNKSRLTVRGSLKPSLAMFLMFPGYDNK